MVSTARVVRPTGFNDGWHSALQMTPMADKQATWCFDEQIASDTAAGGEVVETLLDKMRELGWPEHDTFGVHLAVEEALVNAIKHGNHKSHDKTVRVVLEVSGDRVLVDITDEGEGFDPDAVPDPTDDDNLELPSGRGLMLMRTYMASVKFNDQGNRVTMEKFPTEPPEDDDDWYND